MKLIVEDITDVEYLTEEKDGKKTVYIQGTYLQSEVKNRNQRWYPESILEREVTRYTKDYIDQNRAWGELGHPAGPSVNLDRVSHRIVKLTKEGKNWVGKAQLESTPMGNIAKSLIEGGGQLGVSSRGLGTLKEDREKGHVVQDDFRLAVGADIVADPSAPSAFVKGIMENTEWYYDQAKGTWAEKVVEPIVENISGMSRKEREKEQLALFERFIGALSQPLVTEQSSLHGKFKTFGFVHAGSSSKAGKSVHTYVAGPHSSINNLHRHIKAAGFRHVNRDEDGRIFYKNAETGDTISQFVHRDDEGRLHGFRHEQQVKENWDLEFVNLAEEAGITVSEARRAYSESLDTATGFGRGDDDHYVWALTRRVLGVG